MTRRGAAQPAGARAIEGEISTTAGVIAIGNLQAQIDGQEREAAAGRLTVKAQAGLIDLVALRGHVLGRIADYEWAGALAEQLTQDAPSDGEALLARARTRATFHRFADALTDLDQAQRLGADPRLVDAERAAIFQAVGRYEQALTIYREAVERRADFHSLADLATLYAERGETAAAEGCFSESRARYRGVSPIPLAQLDFKRAQMWITQGDPLRARTWLEAAVRRLPAYAPAQGHLAEVEAALGETDCAIARLLPLTSSCDDPDYAAQLARILAEAGRFEEARAWRDRAAARYDEWSRGISRRTPTAPPSSGSTRAPTRIGRSGSRERTWTSAQPGGPTSSSLEPRVRALVGPLTTSHPHWRWSREDMTKGQVDSVTARGVGPTTTWR
jgi:tetratricopeptide (TPR) repeat protein